MSEPTGGGSRPGADGPLAGVAVCTTFRGEPSQLLQWCDFHLAAGAAQVYVVLDRVPPETVERLPEHPRVRWEVMEQRDWDALYPAGGQHVERKQVDAFRWTARRARGDGNAFLAFVDADELLLLHEPFADLAARHPHTTAFVVPVREMWFEAATAPTGPFSATLAVSPSEPGRNDRDRAFGWRSQFLSHGMLGHAAGKSIYRLAHPLGEVTVHRPRAGGSLASRTLEMPAASATLLHFDAGDPATWNAKWGARLRRDTVARGLWPHRLAQQNLYAHALRRGPEEQQQFFRDFFSLDREARTLLADEGLLDVVDLRDAVAGPLSSSGQAQTGGRLAQVAAPGRPARIQFAMVCDRRFVRPTLATMLSVLVHVGHRCSVRFVVLGDGLEDPDVAFLRAVEHTDYDVEVMVRDVTHDLDRDVGTEDTKRAAFGRMYFVDHLPEQRTVYLDGAVLATRDISELFTIDLGDDCLAGVTDSGALRLVADPTGVPLRQRNRLVGVIGGDPLDYLNSGVLVLALEHPDFRSLALEARALVVRQGRALTQRDQDALNIAFAGRKHRLPSTYNYMTQLFVSGRAVDDDLRRRKYDSADASLIHFSGRTKPWDTAEDEFYNALYRRLVTHAEEVVGVSCGLWFSAPPVDPSAWTSARWVETLAGWPERRSEALTSPPPDAEVLAVHDGGVLLRISSDTYRLAVAAHHEVVGLAGDRELFRVPAGRLSRVRTDLARRVGHGVRHLPVDVSAALGPEGGVARDVEVVLATPGVPDGVVRVIGTLELLAAGDAASPDLLSELGVDGAVDALQDGWLTGWFWAGNRPLEQVALLLDGEPVVVRRPELKGSEDELAAGVRRFTFHLANLRRIGLGPAGQVSVRVAQSNVPLAGGTLTVSDVHRDLRRSARDGSWEAAPVEYRSLAARVLGRLGRAVADRRAWAGAGVSGERRA